MKLNKLLILTGPQGSGNHLWSKVFSSSDLVNGWKQDPTLKWEGHHHEPFSHWWDDPNKIEDTGKKYNFTSISCPYFRDKKPHVPKYKDFFNKARHIYDIQLVIIGRDQNILYHQQERVRGQHTTPKFLDAMQDMYICRKRNFISTELLYLYKDKYINYVSELTGFPINSNITIDEDEFINLGIDTNKKYINAVHKQPLDLEVEKACAES